MENKEVFEKNKGKIGEKKMDKTYEVLLLNSTLRNFIFQHQSNNCGFLAMNLDLLYSLKF